MVKISSIFVLYIILNVIGQEYLLSQDYMTFAYIYKPLAIDDSLGEIFT